MIILALAGLPSLLAQETSSDALILPAAAVVAVLMVGALVMHVKVNDPAVKSLPALLMLVMSGSLLALELI